MGTVIKQMKDRETATPGGKIPSHIVTNAQTSHATMANANTSTISGIASQTDDVGLLSSEFKNMLMFSLLYLF